MPTVYIAVIFAAFVASINAQTCVPPVITHNETGDELYRVLLRDLSDAENKAAAISATAQTPQSASGCTKFENIGDFFTQLLVTITADNTWLDKVGAGFVPSGLECIGVNLRIDFDLKNIQSKADTPVLPSTPCPPTFGAALSQYTLQQFGRALEALAKAPFNIPPGCWEQYVRDLNNGIAAVRAVIAANDVPNCPAAIQTLVTALKGIRLAGSGMPCSTLATTPPSSTTMAGSGYSG